MPELQIVSFIQILLFTTIHNVHNIIYNAPSSSAVIYGKSLISETDARTEKKENCQQKNIRTKKIKM